MTTEQILALDMRKSGNEEKLQKALKKIKKFQKYENEKVPLEEIESLLSHMCVNYCITVQWIHVSHYDYITRYTWGAKRSDTHVWIEDVYGIGLYETTAKLVIMLFSRIKKGEIPKREKEKNES